MANGVLVNVARHVVLWGNEVNTNVALANVVVRCHQGRFLLPCAVSEHRAGSRCQQLVVASWHARLLRDTGDAAGPCGTSRTVVLLTADTACVRNRLLCFEPLSFACYRRLNLAY